MNETDDISAAHRCVDERMDGCTFRDVNDRDAHIVAGVAKHLCRRIRILGANVGENDVPTDPDSPRDGLTNFPSADGRR